MIRRTSFEEIPHKYLCPISLDLMESPVQCSCDRDEQESPIHHFFDRKNITIWLAQSRKCPLTRRPLAQGPLQGDPQLKEEIRGFQSRRVSANTGSLTDIGRRMFKFFERSFGCFHSVQPVVERRRPPSPERVHNMAHLERIYEEDWHYFIRYEMNYIIHAF